MAARMSLMVPSIASIVLVMWSGHLWLGDHRHRPFQRHAGGDAAPLESPGRAGHGPSGPGPRYSDSFCCLRMGGRAARARRRPGAANEVHHLGLGLGERRAAVAVRDFEARCGRRPARRAETAPQARFLVHRAVGPIFPARRVRRWRSRRTSAAASGQHQAGQGPAYGQHQAREGLGAVAVGVGVRQPGVLHLVAGRAGPGSAPRTAPACSAATFSVSTSRGSESDSSRVVPTASAWIQRRRRRAASIELGVLDRHAALGAQGDDDPPRRPRLPRRLRRLPVGGHRSPNTSSWDLDRDAEEAAHRRVPRWGNPYDAWCAATSARVQPAGTRGSATRAGRVLRASGVDPFDLVPAQADPGRSRPAACRRR